MKIFSNLMNHFSVGAELLEFFWKQKLWWMIPFVLLLLVLSIILIFAQATPLGPFIYTVF